MICSKLQQEEKCGFEFCEADYFLAYKNNKIVGRVAAIINQKANQTWNKKEVRFGWIDLSTTPKYLKPLYILSKNGAKNEG